MLDIVIHLTNLKAHVKTAVGAIAGGAVGAAYQVAASPVAVAHFTAADWVSVKHTAVAGAAMAAIGLIVKSPYSQPAAGGQ